jgi:hypothetical protein
MTRAAAPGAPHALLTGMAGEWNRTLKVQMNPAKPPQESHGTASVVALMDGRYIQETVAGQFGGAPYNGMGLYGFDNVSGKYVAVLIDNMGTGFMTCVGTPDTTGKVIRWDATVNDPGSGQPATLHMVTTVTDHDHHTFEMFTAPSSGRQAMKLMTVEYERKH